MKIYLLLAEDPFYTLPFVKALLKRFPSDIVGCAFPKGFINKRRILPTLLIYGLFRFVKTVFIVLYHDMKGGKVRAFLKKFRLDVKMVPDVNSNEFIAYLRKLKVDLIISNNCPQRLKDGILGVPQKGAINLHLGKLPAYRGVFPIFHAISNGEKSFGVTVHYMDIKFDNGAIINQKEIPISPSDDIFALYPKAFQTGTDLVLKSVEEIGDGSVQTHSNGPEGASYFSYPSIREILRYHAKVKNKKVPVNENSNQGY